jgi:predicted flap endonuclease-1-like 5' DNA nuclease
MTFLLAKIFFLLLLAALLGALLARWWLRRYYEDVTTEYTRLSNDWRNWRTSFEAKLAARPEVDLRPVTAGLDRIESGVRGIEIPKPVTTDLGPVLAAISVIRIPEPKDVDLGPMQGRLGQVEHAIKSIPMPRDVDLGPVQNRLTQVEQAVKSIAIPTPKEVDLGPVQSRLAQVEQAVRSIHIPAIPPVDFTDTTRRLDALERAVRAIVIPPSTSVDLSAVMAKLDALAAKPAPNPVAAVAVPTVRAGSRNLLTRAHYGKPDDLKLIKGVKKVMEKMLHGIGVYYFWQIAEWTQADGVHADAQLTAFHGRIARDNWVDQAAQLLTRANSARRPATL